MEHAAVPSYVWNHFDVKTIHAGGGSYYTRRAYDQQGGAVHERELQIWHEYQRHARELDTRFSPAGQHPSHPLAATVARANARYDRSYIASMAASYYLSEVGRVRSVTAVSYVTDI